MPGATTTTYVLQYGGPPAWKDLSRRGTPEAAFERRDAFAASWGTADIPQGLRVVQRVITDTVIEDPRQVPETEEAEVAG